MLDPFPRTIGATANILPAIRTSLVASLVQGLKDSGYSKNVWTACGLLIVRDNL